MIRTPYVAVKNAQKRIPGSKIVLSEQHPPRLQLESGEVLDVEAAAKLAKVSYRPYIWADVNPGGATYITNPTRYESSKRKLAQLVANAHAPCSQDTPTSEAKA